MVTRHKDFGRRASLFRALEDDQDGPGEYAFSLTHARPQYALLPTSGTAQNGKTILSWDQAAAQITRESDGWGLSLGVGATVTYAYRATAPIAMPGDTSGFSQFSVAQIAATETALALWADVANITFVRANASGYSNSATILFGNYSAGQAGASAFAFLPGSTFASSVDGDVWINRTLPDNQDFTLGGFGLQIIAHEIGHAIGLSHPGDYNGGAPTYDVNAIYWQDSRAFSIMSYFGSPNVGGNLPAFSDGPQLHDIAAAQRLYGANTSTRTGDTVYGFNSNTGLAHYTITAATQGAVFAIWDGGGVDTLDLSGYSQNADIDLRAESHSSAGPTDANGPAVFNFSIARGVVIEYAIGGAGNDALTGNSAANRLEGRAGADTLAGAAGADTLDGGLGADLLQGGLGNDLYLVDNVGDGVLEAPSEGADTVFASISYTLAGNVENLTLSGAALLGTGNELDNRITGFSIDNRLEGRGGADILDGGLGADVLDGGAGVDTASYASSAAPVRVNLGTGSALEGEAAGDSFVSIENLTGSQLGDVLTGNAGANVIDGLNGADNINGGDGDDILIGGAGGDVLNGGVGSDAASYVSSVYAVNVNLGTGVTSGGQSNGDSFVSIENLIGSQLGDVLSGDGAANRINGGAGNDALSGGGGDDTFVFAPGAGQDRVLDFIAGGSEDSLDFSAYNGTGITYTVSQAGADTLFQFSNGDAITLVNVNSADLVQTDPYGWS